MATNSTSQKARVVEQTEQNEVVESTTKKKLSAKDIDMHQYVTVRNGFQGRLFYKSSRTGEKFVWDGFGSEQEMELLELRNAKNSKKQFFVNNWFMFDEDWVVDFLGVKQYYRNAVSVSQFDDIFANSADKIKEIVGSMSAGQKRSAAYRARQLIAEGTIDSNKAITALEESLGVELVDRG